MIVYIVNWVAITLYAFIIRNRYLLIYLIGFQLFLILACRAEDLGADLVGYKYYYEYMQRISFIEMIKATRFFVSSDMLAGHESGYDWFQWIFSNAGFSFHSFLVLHAAICFISISYFIFKYSYNPCLSFLMFCSLGAWGSYFGILRFALAKIILLFAIESTTSENLSKFLSICFLSICFHRAALMILPLYLISKIKFSRLIFTIYLFLCAVWGISLNFIFNKLLAFFLFFSAGKMEHYGYKEIHGNFYIILMLATCVFVFLFLNKVPPSKNSNNTLIWSLMLCLPCQIMTFFSTNFSRVAGGFYFLFSIILVPNILRGIENVYLRYMLIICVYCFCTWFHFEKMNPYIVPYRAYF